MGNIRLSAYPSFRPVLVLDGSGPNAIGGIEGIVDQTLAAGVDLAGMS